MIELYEGFYVNLDAVAVVKAAGDDACALFTSGQSAVDEGFHIPYPVDEVAQQLDDAEREFYDEEEEDDEDDQDDDEDDEDEEPEAEE
jgi:hypothetical protein